MDMSVERIENGLSHRPRQCISSNIFPNAIEDSRRTNGRRERNHRQLSSILFDARHRRGVLRDSKNSFDFKEIDRGKIICVAMPQKYQMERRYINTFLKMLVLHPRFAPFRPAKGRTRHR